MAVAIEAVEADVCPRSRQPPRLCRLLKMMLSSKSTEFFLELIFCLSSSSKLKDSLLRRQFIEAKLNKGISKPFLKVKSLSAFGMKSSLKSKYSNFYSLMRFEINKNLQYYHEILKKNIHLVNMQEKQNRLTSITFI